MRLKITANTLLTKHYLFVRSDGVDFMEASGLSRKKFFRFGDIQCILLSSENKLSLQVGDEVFAIPTRPDDRTHQTVIATLVQEVKRAHRPD